MDQQKKKLAIGWFSFTCCEDSTILLTELLNDHLDEWKKVIDFKHVRSLKTKNTIEGGLDVAFIEGAVSSESEAEEVKTIRNNAKYVVAIGSCACTGMPSASRNDFTPDDITERIKWYMETFDYGKVQKLDEVIKVDDYVQGCPMNVPSFIGAVEKYLKVFNIL